MNEEENGINKTADNKITSINKEIKTVDNNISSSKQIINSLNSIEESFASLNKNLTKCIDLLSNSIKGKKASAILNNATETKTVNIRNSLSDIDNYREEEKARLKKYEEEREELLKKQREEEKNKESTDTRE